MFKIAELSIALFLLLNAVFEILSHSATNLKFDQEEMSHEYNTQILGNFGQVKHRLFKRNEETDDNGSPLRVDVQRFHEYFREVVGEVKKKINDYVEISASSLKKLKIEAEKNIREAEIKAVEGINENRKKAEEDIHQNKINAALKIQEVSDKMVAHVSSKVDEAGKAAVKVIKDIELKLDEFLKSYEREFHKKHHVELKTN